MSDCAPPGIAGKSILLFDSGLLTLDGHWYAYDRDVAEVHRRNGCAVTLICNRSFADYPSPALAGVELLPILEQSMWTGHGLARGRFGELAGLVRHAAYLADVLIQHLGARKYDLVLMPNATVFDALAWLFVRLRGRAGRVGRIAFLLRFSVPGLDFESGRPLARKFAIWRAIFRTFRSKVARGETVYLTDSSRLAQEYRTVASIDPRVVPHPQTAAPQAPQRQLGGAGAMTFALIGFATWGRGVDLFEQAIALLLQTGRAENLRFVLQWHVDVVRPDGTRYEPSAVVAGSSQVSIIRSQLPQEDYNRMFDEIDCMVLPYRRETYKSQISGVATEAACADIPMIVTEDCWLSDLLEEQGAGLKVPDCDVAALADAIAEMAASRDHYAQEARRCGVRARAFNSPDKFLRRLWAA